ncbi:MAG: hypothetical protein SFY80_12230 [Verrucomicrobiota bacterium]|nr:hypothetical protein [Verrucomicrobiota bacterium]
MKTNTTNPWVLRQQWLLMIGLAVMAAIIVLSPPRMVYDEVYYVPFARDVYEDGIASALQNSTTITTGPGHGIFYAVLYPLTQNTMPLTRVLGMLAFMVGLFFLGRVVKMEGPPGWLVLSALGIPSVWLFGGLALTEPVAITLLAIALWVLVRKPVTVGSTSTTAAWLVLAGLLSGAAIITRQPMLVFVPGMVLLAWMHTRNLWLCALFICVTVVLPVQLFTAWGGLTSPSIRVVTEGLRWVSLPLAFAHLGLGLLFIAPYYFLSISWRWHSLALTAGMLINSVVFKIEYLPFYRLIHSVLGDSAMHAYGLVCGGIMVGSAASVLVCATLHLRKHRGNLRYLSYTLGCFLFALTAMKITHQFSSRYVIAALPMILLVGIHHYRAGAVAFIFSATGIAVGSVQLLAHYWYS